MKRPTLLGHPLHPLMVHAPIGGLVAATAFQLLGLVGLPANEPARWALWFGLAGAVLAIGTGLVDLLAAPSGPVVERRLFQHLGAMIGAVSCYGAASVVQAPAATLVLHLIGLALLLAGGWAGGELVYGHGVGTPNPLGEEPCTSRRSPAPAERSSSR